MAKLFQSKKNTNEEELYIPEHIGIIMDGNGRWAKKRLLSRSFGHKAGGETLRKICYAAKDLGIHYLTVYAFSTENWKRSKEEIENIMNIFLEFFTKYQDEFIEMDCRVKFSGQKENIPSHILETIEKLENLTKDLESFQLNIAFNYGGRQEIVDAVNQFLKKNPEHEGPLRLEDIQENLYLPKVPDPDLIIRTSGEFRTSNFLLWEQAYSEYWVTDTLWPDFTGEDLKEAIRDFNTRDRRFGGVKDE